MTQNKCQSSKWISKTNKDSAAKLCKRIRVSFAQDSLKCQNLNYKRLVFEQEKDLVIQWLNCVIIQKLAILLKVNIEVTCV